MSLRKNAKLAPPLLMRLSTEMLPERDRMAAFREEIARATRNMDIRDFSGGRPRFDVVLIRLGAIRVASIAGTASEWTADPRHHMDGDVQLLLPCEGSPPIRAQQVGRDHVCEAGSAVLMHFARLYRAQATCDGSKTRFITVSPAALKELVAHPEDRAGQLVRPNQALHLLDGYLRSLTALEQLPSAELRQLIGVHLLDLMAAAMGPTAEGRAVIADRGLKAARLQAVLAEIARRCGDPAFDIDAISMRLGLSRRNIRSLLAETGKSFTEHLTERRLQRACGMLADPGCAHLRIIDIAFAAGFGDLSNFNRLFRRRFGEAPSAVRTRGGVQG